MFKADHQAGQQIPGIGTFRVAEPGIGTARDVEQVVNSTAHHTGFPRGAHLLGNRLTKGRGKPDDARPMLFDPVARHEPLAQFRHQQQTADMLAIAPEAEGSAPFLETGTEILRAIDRIEQRDSAAGDGLGRVEAFLPDERQSRYPALEKAANKSLHKDVSRCNGTAIGLPGYITPPGKNLRKIGHDKVGDSSQELAITRPNGGFFRHLCPRIIHREVVGHGVAGSNLARSGDVPGLEGRGLRGSRTVFSLRVRRGVRQDDAAAFKHGPADVRATQRALSPWRRRRTRCKDAVAGRGNAAGRLV